MAPINPTLTIFSALFLLSLACPTPGQKIDFSNFRSPYDDLPKWSKDWTPHDWQTAMDRTMQAQMYGFDRTPRDSTAPSSCASPWAKQTGGMESAAPAAALPEGPVAIQFADASQRSGPDDYGYYNGQQAYQSQGSVFQQHPNLAQFNRFPTTNSWNPGYNGGGAVGEFYSRASDQILTGMGGNQHADQYSKHPVQKLPEVIDTAKAADQYGFASPNMYMVNYRANEPKPQPAAEEINSIKTTSPQYFDLANYYRQQIQQALADGKQLSTAGFPGGVQSQQFAPGAAEKQLSSQASPVFSTATFPLTALTFDPEEMKRVYGPYYVPPVFNLVQRQPNSFEGAPPGVVRDVLQYLLNQYQSGGVNSVSSGYRNQRLLPDISKKHEMILHGFAPLEKLPRQSMPQLPAFGGDNQMLPPNMYRNEKWEPKTNLVVHEPVNLGDFEQSGMNQMQYVARSTPCSRNKRQSGGIWGYYPELYPGMKSVQSPMTFGAPQYGVDQTQMRTAIPGYEDPLRQPMGGLGQPMGGFGQPTGGLQPGYPGYPNYPGRNAMSGLEQMITGITQFMPMIAGSGMPQIMK